MPEMLEIEMYRRGAEVVRGRVVSGVETPDTNYVKGAEPAHLADLLVGQQVVELGRLGKLLLVELSGVTLGLRFGMTGILVIDGEPVLPELEYSAKRQDPAWNRFVVTFENGGVVAINDPRRLGSVEVEPDTSKLGPDAWSITEDQLAEVLGRSRSAIKSLLLNQQRIAGLGNLLADELLWRAGIDPTRPANTVDAESTQRLAHDLGAMLPELYERGGSTSGDHFEERHPDGRCPRDGHEMRSATIGGRTTWWCPHHQR